MKESHRKHSGDKGRKRKHKNKRSSSSSSSSDSDEWVEKKPNPTTTDRDSWMSMTGMIKTYTRDDVKPKTEKKDKKHIDSYNPASCSRELNPYWKNGGTGLPQTPEEFRKAKPFIKPSTDDNQSFYKKSYYTKDYKNKELDRKERHTKEDVSHYSKTYNWRKGSDIKDTPKTEIMKIEERIEKAETFKIPQTAPSSSKLSDGKYLSDEKMNKLAAKIVKAEIMGDTKLVNELKSKLETARQFRKDNPNASVDEEIDDSVMLMSTSQTGNVRPLSKSSQSGDPRSKGGRKKVETHVSGDRTKYFAEDDKHSLAQMFEQEKYGNNYDDEAQIAKIAAKHKNPNDDLEDIFTDEISKNVNPGKYDEKEKSRAIREHTKVVRSIEGCEYCIDSKKMLKHLMVSCGTKVYVAVPSRKSLVKGHCFITTIQHSTCVTSLDEDVWEEIMNYRKALTQLFNSQNKDVVFFETASKLHKHPHMVINCVPLPRDVGDTAPIYFKKAILECEAEWSMNKKVVDLQGKNIRKGVPKGLPYFWIDFGMEPGYAHVIEDQQLFPKTFAEEIIGGILDLDHNVWRNPQKEYGDYQRRKVLEFIQDWKPFDPVHNT